MKSIFYCDIVGTFDSNCSEATRARLVSEFVTLLSQLDEEEILFSFVSTLPMEEIMKRIKELDKCLKELEINNVKFGVQYGDGVAINLDNKKVSKTANDKVSQIIEDIKENSYDKIYYADDTKLNVKMIEYLTAKINKNIQVTLFVPGENGMKGLNSLCELISGYVYDKNTRNKIFKK